MKGSLYDSIEIPRWDRYTSIKREEAEFIGSFLKGKKIGATLEIGLAYGASAVYILAATKKPHYAMDPYQNERYKGIGLRNIRKLGFGKNLFFEEDFSYNVLPHLLGKGVRVDFAFIDGGHKFDEIFLDFFYADLLLNQGGYMLFDDLWMRSTQLVLAWIKKNRADYSEIKIPSERMVMIRKIGHDKREWYHFNEFYNFKSFLSHAKFKRLQKEESTRLK